MQIRSISSFLLLLAFPLVLQAQKVTYQSEHFSVEDGMPNHWVLSMLQHSSGFLWVGTTQGLCRFDGYEFTTIVPQGVASNAFAGSIWRLNEIDGEILIRTGLPSLRNGDDIFYKYQPSSNTASEISEDLYNLGLEQIKLPHSNSRDIAPVVEIEDGVLETTSTDIYGNKLIVSSRNRAPLQAELMLNAGEWLDLSEEWKTLHTAATSVSNNFGDVIYWGGYNGLLKISVRRSPFDLILHEEAEDWEYRNICRAMIEVNEDTILISTENNKEAIYDKKSDSASFISWNANPLAIAGDVNPYRSFMRFGVEGDVIGVKWSNINRMNVENNERSVFISEPNKTLASSPFGNSKFLVARRITGEFAYVLEVYDLETKSHEKFVPVNGGELFSKARPTYILPTSDSTVWYCTKSGLFNLDIWHDKILHLYLDKNAEVKSYDFPVSYNLSGPHIWVVHDSGDGKLWIGMDGVGLNVLNVETDKVEHLTTADGLPNNTVVGILPDSTGYWISTFKGLAHYNPTSAQFRNFYRSNGIAHDEFNRFSFMKDGEGKYYFGSMNGITSFYPEDVLGRPYDLKLLVSEVSHYDKKGSEVTAIGSDEFNNKEIQVPSSNRFLSIKMCLSDFNNPQGNTFFYRLENIGILPNSTHANWKALGMNHELRFENLEAGKYRLSLKGISAQGMESDEVVLIVRVNQFFYKTWWFISALAVALIFAMYSLHVFRLKQAMKMEKLRTRLSSDLHDDVGGLLSGIALQMDALGYTIGDEHKSLVQRIARSSRSAMEKMRDVVWAIDAREAHLHDLKARMLEFAEEVLGPLDISYSIEVTVESENILLRSEVRHNFLLIFKEFVNNTVKHADASRVDVKFNKRGKAISMVIRDDGIGFDPASAKGTGQGIRNMIMRAEKMGSSLEFLQGKGFGISVEVQLH